MVKNLMWLIGGCLYGRDPRAGPQREIVNSVGVNLGESPQESRSTEHAHSNFQFSSRLLMQYFYFDSISYFKKKNVTVANFF